MPKRQSNDPRRRIASAEDTTPDGRAALAGRAVYVGMAVHKSRPADYGFHPPFDRRPDKSLCDGHRTIRLAEAKRLLEAGIRRGVYSRVSKAPGLPAYVWAVDENDIVYEAKPGNGGYHGYVLDPDREETMCRLVREAWMTRA